MQLAESHLLALPLCAKFWINVCTDHCQSLWRLNLTLQLPALASNACHDCQVRPPLLHNLECVQHCGTSSLHLKRNHLLKFLQRTRLRSLLHLVVLGIRCETNRLDPKPLRSHARLRGLCLTLEVSFNILVCTTVPRENDSENTRRRPRVSVAAAVFVLFVLLCCCLCCFCCFFSCVCCCLVLFVVNVTCVCLCNSCCVLLFLLFVISVVFPALFVCCCCTLFFFFRHERTNSAENQTKTENNKQSHEITRGPRKPAQPPLRARQGGHHQPQPLPKSPPETKPELEQQCTKGWTTTASAMPVPLSCVGVVALT